MLHQVNLFIDIEILQRIQQLAVAHLIDQVVPDVFRRLKQDVTALFIFDQSPQGVALFRGQSFEGIGEVWRWQVGHQRPYLSNIVG